MNMGFAAAGVVLMIIYFVVIIAYLGISIYCIVLFIKLATRGIKALDIYNSKKRDPIEGELQEVTMTNEEVQ